MRTTEMARMLLSSATEDRQGLYEAVWEINGRFPDLTLGQKYDGATAALLELHRHGWIRFEREFRSLDNRESEDVPGSDVVTTLGNPVSWYPEYDGSTIVFMATQTGLAHYMAGGDE